MPINMQQIIIPIVSADPIDDSGFIDGNWDYWLDACVLRLRTVRAMGVYSKSVAYMSPDILIRMAVKVPEDQGFPIQVLQCGEDRERLVVYVDFNLPVNTIRIG